MARKNEEFEDSENEADESGEEFQEEFSEEEENFDDDLKGESLRGFNEGLLSCDYCGRDVDPDNAIVKEINGEEHTFCSEKCANFFKKEFK